MNQPNIHNDIKESIVQHFAFLKTYSFSDFKTSQLAYELHLECKNAYVTIDMMFEGTLASPVLGHIDGYLIDTLEPENPQLELYKNQQQELYERLFQPKTAASGNRETVDQYICHGKKLNDLYIQELGAILKRYPEVLKGDKTLLEKNYAQLQQRAEERKAEEKVKNKIYTCHYTIDDFIDCEYEAEKITDIKAFLKEQSAGELTEVRVYDWYMTPVVFSLD